MSVITWLSENELWLSILISSLSVFFTLLLTVMIIIQTWKLNNKQIEFDLLIHSKQAELQKREIRLNSYPYKREIYSFVFSVLELCEQFEEISRSVDFHSKTPEQLHEILIIFQNQYVPDTRKALWSMREAEYVLPRNISTIVTYIRRDYDSMCSNLMALVSISKMMAQNELEKQFKEVMKSNIEEALNCCRRINAHKQFIEAIMPEELNISELSR